MKRRMILYKGRMTAITPEIVLEDFFNNVLKSSFLIFIYIAMTLVVISDTQWSLYLFIMWNIIYILSLLILTIYTYIRTKNYGYTFLHSYPSFSSVIMSLFILYTFLPIPFYCAYILPYYRIFIPFMIFFIILTSVYSLLIYKKWIKNNFSKCYFTICDTIFFDSDAYADNIAKSHHINWQKRFCYYALPIMTIFIIILYSKRFPSWGAIGISLCCLFFFILFNNYIVQCIYTYFFVHRNIEKTFGKPLLSDAWGLLQGNEELSEKIFGKDPEKRPIQYEEVFPQKTSE